MIDSKQLNHDLAIAAAAIAAYKNYDLEISGSTPAEKRAALADYLLDEYNFFFDYYGSSKK